MTEEKFCPIISTVTMIPCQKEKCLAFKVITEWPQDKEKCRMGVF